MTEYFEVKLERIRKLSDSTRDFRFVRTDGGLTEYKPGQFFRFIFTDGSGQFERSYSLCNFDAGESGKLDLLISTVEGGRASELLFGCEEGTRARVSGPFGRLLVPEKLPGRLFLVATSVGIAPYMPMLGQLSSALREGELELYFIYGTRDRSEFIYGDKLRQYADDHQGFHLNVCYSRELNSGAGDDKFRNDEFKGYVQERLKELTMSPVTDHILLCGNPMMIDETYAWLKSEGFGVRQVIREKYVFAKRPQLKKKTGLTEEQKKLIAEKVKKYQG